MTVAKAQPAGLAAPGAVAIRISEAANQALLLAPGWSRWSRASAQRLAVRCTAAGRADRKNPLPPGQRIALQALARQIEARLNKER